LKARDDRAGRRYRKRTAAGRDMKYSRADADDFLTKWRMRSAVHCARLLAASQPLRTNLSRHVRDLKSGSRKRLSTT